MSDSKTNFKLYYSIQNICLETNRSTWTDTSKEFKCFKTLMNFIARGYENQDGEMLFFVRLIVQHIGENVSFTLANKISSLLEIRERDIKDDELRAQQEDEDFRAYEDESLSRLGGGRQ